MAKKKQAVRRSDTTVATAQTPHELGYRMPAEWEPHEATWLAWPHEPSDWPGKFDAVPWVFAEIARHLVDGEKIRLIVRNDTERRRAAAAFKSAGVKPGRVSFFRAPTDRSWTRDFLPLGVVRGARGRRELAAVKWRFNGWARYDNYATDQRTGMTIARALRVPVFQPRARVRGRIEPVVLEGGAIDVDGEGTLLATEQCLLNGKQARNRALGKTGMEAVLREYLGATKVLWLEDGIAGDDTGGHVDDLARFVAPGVIALAEETRRADPNYGPLKGAYQRLRSARDARGRRLEIVRLPMPKPVVFAGERLPASYANFYVGNSAVLVPTFNDPNDRIALGILAGLFPGRKVVGIHSVDFVLGLGTIHCSTQQQPAARR